MPPLPRAECPVCGRWVAVRKRGQLREHRNVYDGFCAGAGQVATRYYEEPMFDLEATK